MTVHGDLILADGAANVSLDNVRVTGRIVIRGGGEGVQLTGTSAGSGTVVANPNGTTRLDASACDLGTVTAQSDLSIDGKVDRVLVSESAHITVEKGAAVDAITVAAENTRDHRQRQGLLRPGQCQPSDSLHPGNQGIRR